MRILITGGCGFVGSSLGIALKSKYQNYKIYALDNLMRRGSELNIKRLNQHGIQFVHGDIRSYNDLLQIGEVDLIIEAAAEPSVQSGVLGSPDYTIETNLVGTLNCLKLANSFHARLIFLSTSRVYSIEELNNISFDEDDTRFVLGDNQQLKGVSPEGIDSSFSTHGAKSFYGATKFASEVMLNEYQEFLDLQAVVNRCGVLAGPWQFGKVDQGFVVLWLAHHFWKKPLHYIGFGGNGKQVRDVLHVDDLFDLIDFQIHNFDKVKDNTYNVGGGPSNATSLLELTYLCQEITGNRIPIDPVVDDRKADVRIYITDNAEVSETGWAPKRSLRSVAEDIHSWLKSDKVTLSKIFN